MARDALKMLIPWKMSQKKVHINHVNICSLSLLYIHTLISNDSPSKLKKLLGLRLFGQFFYSLIVWKKKVKMEKGFFKVFNPKTSAKRMVSILTPRGISSFGLFFLISILLTFGYVVNGCGKGNTLVKRKSTKLRYKWNEIPWSFLYIFNCIFSLILFLCEYTNFWYMILANSFSWFFK